ncbi:aminoglycoside phosphotransferase (APT) family kinase protein [Pullulanibacillus pueri]|uniref:Aminoglycoside phosphotransferase domain-containing protein n=1 Tax=Pullulanibacillus pueri TaxID=1437324 RepID=A0A8J3EPG4_9BACL|nr:aminoglycoside phosphotransferase family protein [Pullulanibacillus pueri]MBM7683345.1 aminoglycoside phosphotransferase (APT) family kinase protein [Pullulanibacillus pueri]GGH86650.1 hypothetical protein GCM10007096_34850 [Pullulanibacillus pueri]
MNKKLSFDEIKALIKIHYPHVTYIKELSGGLASQTYLFEVGEQRFVFQVGSDLESYKKEGFIAKTFNAILPVRCVLEVHRTDDRMAYSISKYIEGDKLFDLNSQQLFDIVPAVLNTLESLESIEVSNDHGGYGYFDSTGHAPYPTWLDFVTAVYNSNIYSWDVLEERGLDSEVVNKAMEELKTHIKSIHFSDKNIVHGDLGSYNLLAKDNQITGIIDWSLSMYGDHLYDKANFLFWNEEKLQPLIKEIKNQYMTTTQTKEIIYCYMLRIGLEEIYNTVIRHEVGYDIDWVTNRLNEIIDHFL